ncbi:MAG: RNA polymerase sigma factor FliA [Gammaproteobacteria bacterium]
MAKKGVYQDQHQRVQEDLVHRFAPLVKRIAHHLMARLPATVSVEDLIQSGMMGLLEAAKRYEANKGASFETYAGIRIKGAMLDELRKGDWTPRSVHRNARLVSETMRTLLQQLGRHPTDAEIAAALGISQADYHTLLNDTRGARLFHFSDLSEEDDEYVFKQVVDQDDLLTGVEQERFWSGLVNAIKGLPEREQLVLALYYTEGLNLKEIGEVLGVSESRVSQIHTQAALRLRTKMADWVDLE